MNNGGFLSNIFSYFAEKRISATEKVLLVLGVLIYWISPVDLMPLVLIDDIGITGAVMAYMNWRVNHLPTISSTDNAGAIPSDVKKFPLNFKFTKKK